MELEGIERDKLLMAGLLGVCFWVMGGVGFSWGGSVGEE